MKRYNNISFAVCCEDENRIYDVLIDGCCYEDLQLRQASEMEVRVQNLKRKNQV